ncbi:methylglyoxal synthase [Bacillus sp. FJAT-42315]|uniref:methylglyoxal synthase n=1 Tax=Bacillus sp. FJAT-42315 TaxID=2014077 RepID=UPI000C2476D2|nr:methylglyoxal synthase [Bacillus sp. FJAT-42315]
MKVALIAHDKKKDDLIEFVADHRQVFEQYDLFATGTTGRKIAERTGLTIHCFQSGPLGGDQEIGASIARKEMDIVFFFRDPLTSQPHEPDVSALVRLCDVYAVPLATNIGTATMLIKGMERGDLRYLEGKRLSYDGK